MPLKPCLSGDRLPGPGSRAIPLLAAHVSAGRLGQEIPCPPFADPANPQPRTWRLLPGPMLSGAKQGLVFDTSRGVTTLVAG